MSAHIAVGGNIEPESHVARAPSLLQAVGTVLAVSRLYRTAAIGRRDQADYWNGIVVLDPAAGYADGASLREALREIEAAEGRVRTADRFAARTLDLDVLMRDGRPAGPAEAKEIRQRSWIAWALHDLGGPRPPGTSPPTLEHAAWRVPDRG